jgi:hypothetical protein
LSSEDSIDRICAALNIMQMAYEGQIRFRMRGGTGGLASMLIEMIKHPGREADAAGWAMGWLSEGPVSTKTALSAKQQSTLIASLTKNPRITPLALKFSTWALDDSHRSRLHKVLPT